MILTSENTLVMLTATLINMLSYREIIRF